MNKLSKMALIAVTVIVVSATATMAATAKLSSGTAIDAKITETINGSAAQVGQRILMVVDKDPTFKQQVQHRSHEATKS